MTQEDKELLDEKFKGLALLVNAQFHNVQDKLDKIHEEAIKSNSRIGKLEDFRASTMVMMASVVTPEMLGRCEEKFEERVDCVKKDIEDKFKDLGFFLRHPKLFIGGLVVIILLTLATLLESNPFKVFAKDTTKVELNSNQLNNK
jgi:hypothetical protein